MRILLPIRTISAALGVTLALLVSARTEPNPEMVFHHGINIKRLFDLSEAAARRLCRSAIRTLDPRSNFSMAELKRLRNAGFDFIRLPIDPGPFLALDDGRGAVPARLRACFRLYPYSLPRRALRSTSIFTSSSRSQGLESVCHTGFSGWPEIRALRTLRRDARSPPSK